MANVVVVVAEAKCGVQGYSGPDARALRRIETRRGVPGWLERGRPLTSPPGFLSVCLVCGAGGKKEVLDTKYDFICGDQARGA